MTLSGYAELLESHLIRPSEKHLAVFRESLTRLVVIPYRALRRIGRNTIGALTMTESLKHLLRD